MVSRADERVHPAVLHPEPAQKLERFVFAKIDKFTFDLRADDNGFGPEMMARIIPHKIDMSRRRVSLFAFCNRSEIGLGDVAREQSRLGCEQEEITRDDFLL